MMVSIPVVNFINILHTSNLCANIHVPKNYKRVERKMLMKLKPGMRFSKTVN